MKRFLALTAVVGLLAGLGAQAAAAVCEGDGGASFCQYSTGCYEMSSEYSSVGGVCAEGECTCAQVIAGCKKDGALYSGVDKTAPGMGSPTWGGGVKCKDAGGTLVGTAGPEACGKYCLWPTGCVEIATDPAGSYNPEPVTSCADAIANCKANGLLSDDEACSDVANVKVQWCRWDGDKDKCYPINDPSGSSSDNPGMTNLEACQAYGELFDSETECKSAAVSGVFCDYGPASEYGEGGCYWLAGADAATKCTGDYGTVVTSCSGSGSAVKFLGNSKAKAAGLKVSYAKNRVSVNWTPAAKVASGTVQLINAKGVTLSTAFIKANSGKVSVKLATVGVPTGMYFVHINAVGVNGKKIVTQSAISIVK